MAETKKNYREICPIETKPWNDPAISPHVRFVGVTKKFGDFVAVDNISLDIYKSEFFSLLGPSGCGKTTLLRMLAGFETPTSGSILLDDEDLSSIPPYSRPVNMMFQSYALFPHMSVAQNIAFGLKQDRVAKAEIDKRVAEIAELVQLGEFLQRKPHQLSGGQRQRVALARSVVKKPKILLLDEPLAALDKKLREQTQFELMNIQDELGITFVIVTHDQEEAMTVSSRIAVMDHGRVIQVATPNEIYEYPNSRYVAEFIGDVNMFQGHLGDIQGDYQLLQSPETNGQIRVGRVGRASQGANAWVAVRPEKLLISLEPPENAAYNCISGTVWDIGYLGNLSVYHVKLDNGKKVTSVQTNQSRLIERKITWEDRVYLCWQPEAGVLLLN